MHKLHSKTSAFLGKERSSCASDDLWHAGGENTHRFGCLPAGHDNGRFGGEMWPFVGATLTPPLDAVGQQIA